MDDGRIPDLQAHPFMAALLRLVSARAAGIDATIDHRDGHLVGLEGRIAAPGLALGIDHREEGTRVDLGRALPASALAATEGRLLSEVVDLPPAAGDEWRTLRILSATDGGTASVTIEQAGPVALFADGNPEEKSTVLQI